MYSENIHYPTIRYFHKIFAHTLLGKEANITSVSKDELFIMYSASQSRPVNVVTFMFANMDEISKATHGPIIIRGLVTMIANEIGLRYQLNMSEPLGRIRPIHIRFGFNCGFIRNLPRNLMSI